MRRTGRAAVSLVVVLSVVAAGACGGGDEEGADDRPTSTTVNEEAAVLSAYEAGWRAFEEASGNPVDPDHPALAETMTGPALEDVRNGLAEMAELQEYLEGPPAELSPRVTDVSADRATIEDCVIDATARHAADGTVVGPPNSTPHANETVMVKEDGVWKTFELTLGDPCER